MAFDGSGPRGEDRRVAVRKKPVTGTEGLKQASSPKLRAPQTKRQVQALEFGMLASKWQIYANRATGDSEARELVHILWALKEAFAEDDPWLDGVARKARAYLKKHNRGPRARPAEADLLARHIGLTIVNGVPLSDLAQRLLRHLQALPELCGETIVPISGAWPDAEQAHAEELVRKALEPLLASGKKDPESWAKAALKALGHRSTKNMFAHRKT